MARYVRLYDSPSPERSGNVLGFSSGIAHAANDARLHEWLKERGYTVTPESEAQRKATISIGGFAIRTTQYHEVEGIPIPDSTVSAGHLFVEPPLKEDDVRRLGGFLAGLRSLDDGGLRRHLFIDNRHEEPLEAYDYPSESVITQWS